jgi:hypothetical protein
MFMDIVIIISIKSTNYFMIGYVAGMILRSRSHKEYTPMWLFVNNFPKQEYWITRPADEVWDLSLYATQKF